MTLNRLPNDIIRLLGEKYLRQAEIFSLAHTARFFKNALITHGTNELKTAYANEHDLLRKLQSHAALGEWEKAEQLWEMYPDLLTCRGTVYHPNYIYNERGEAVAGIPFYINPGRYQYVNMTAFQIALVNEEWEEAERMAKYLPVEEQQKQWAEVFPADNIIKHNRDLAKAKELLKAVFAEIIKDPAINENDLSKMSESTRKALLALYAYVKPKDEHKTGLVFDANFYLEALKMYEDQFSQFGNWDQRSFWCIRVEEWLAGCLGTAYLRPHARGSGNPLHRGGCILADGSSYFSFRRPITSILGFHHFVGYYGESRTYRPWRLEGWFDPGTIFSKLMSSKNASRERLYATLFAPGKDGMSNLLK